MSLYRAGRAKPIPETTYRSGDLVPLAQADVAAHTPRVQSDGCPACRVVSPCQVLSDALALLSAKGQPAQPERARPRRRRRPKPPT